MQYYQGVEGEGGGDEKNEYRPTTEGSLISRGGGGEEERGRVGWDV